MNKSTNLPFVKLSMIIVALSMLVVGCSNSGQTGEETTDSISVDKQVKKLVNPVPTPVQITDMLNKAGASYIIGIANRPDRADTYFTESAKALNLGIYGADMCYSATYGMTQETTNFFMCTKKLRDGLDIQTPENDSVAAKLEANISNRDSIYSILNRSFTYTFDYLNDNGKGSVAVLVIAGGWIEGLYLSTELSGLLKKNDEIMQGIADQKGTLDKLIPLMENYKDNQNVSDILKSLSTIKAAFDELKEVDGKTQMTKEGYNKIKKEASALRKKIVETT
ncbi:MAG: hypothetical protein U0W24_23265 [Bacteroidales bacterium]